MEPLDNGTEGVAGSAAFAVPRIAASFAAAARGGPDALLHAVTALRGLILATALPDGDRVPPETIADASAAITAAAPIIAEAVAGRLPAEAVYMGMGAATAIASLFGRPTADIQHTTHPGLFADRLDHIALLADELDALHRRRRIEGRGDVLRRSITIRRALAATPDGASLN